MSQAIRRHNAAAALLQISELQKERTNELLKFHQKRQLIISDDEENMKTAIYDIY